MTIDRNRKACLLVHAIMLLLWFAAPCALAGHDAELPTVPEGFTIERVAAPPLVERPITGALDDAGRLYVADSSGSNDPVEKQLEERPHRILRLEDTDGDGRYDQSTVFADRMMFPAGTMFHEGSLYVAAPPSIWKLTDTDGDGVADERVEWFQGTTLTGCANDLHGPYLGLDGWIYWCKGAFAEQTHVVNGKTWKSRAAHIFRARPDGTGLEPVLTGGMDNPVDVAFLPDGERILSATFLTHPSQGERDGLIHAIYGGVYGKDHGVLEDHPRTGPLMPVLAHLGPAAPSGLECYEASAFGEGFQGNLFACQFNLRKVSRHILRPEGATFESIDSDFVTSTNVDFHPTDVLEDADGSLLVIDTGGWYKLCCPTSQLWKPDVLGAIYRVRRTDAPRHSDPRGSEIDWSGHSVEQVWKRLADERTVVRRRAARELAKRRDSDELQQFLAALPQLLPQNLPVRPTTAHVWALNAIGTTDCSDCVRHLLTAEDATIRLAALNLVSLNRDRAAVPQLLQTLAHDGPRHRRLAAEALGRLAERSAVAALLRAAARAKDRTEQHAITYALIEIADAEKTRHGLASDVPAIQATALLALDQMPAGELQAREVIPLLASPDERLRDTAHWLTMRHPEWSKPLAAWLVRQLEVLATGSEESSQISAARIESLLVQFSDQPEVQAVIASANDPERSRAARHLALRAMGQARLSTMPTDWSQAVTRAMQSHDVETIELAIGAAHNLSPSDASSLSEALADVARRDALPTDLRVRALAARPAGAALETDQFELLVAALAPEAPVDVRSAAADALAGAALSRHQLLALCTSLSEVGPLEIHRLLDAFKTVEDEAVGLQLLKGLQESPVVSSLRFDVVRETLSHLGPQVQQEIDRLQQLVNVDTLSQRQAIEALLPQMRDGDVRRGQLVFKSAKAACSACHRIGYVGGDVGPDLTRIGETRTERDLLESILYPSISFVRSYEPTVILTVDGRVLSGVIRDEAHGEIVLATGPNEEVRIASGDVEEVHPGTVSVMPAGLDKLLSAQELADLVAFLKSTAGN